MPNPNARAALLEGLNTDLAYEYQAIIGYLVMSRLLTGPDRPALARFLDSEIEDELGHARLLAHKIVALGGTPTTRPAEVELARSNREILEILLQAEKDTIARYTERVQQADAAGEIGLRVDLEQLVSDETRHKEDLERILLDWRD
ncbi:MAG TPA: ferritin-like domain-containing protein [Longimicrobiales bacterium]